MSEFHTVKIGTVDTELKMTMGLLNELARIIGDIDRVADFAFDPDLRAEVLVALLSERDNKGKITKPLEMFTLDMSPDDAVEVLDWVGSHVTDFFLKSMTRTKAMSDLRKEQFQSLAPTSAGGAV